MVEDKKISGLAVVYEKLKNFLRAVPTRYDREWGHIPQDGDLFDQFAGNERGNGECPVGPFRRYTTIEYNPDGSCCNTESGILLWMPGNSTFNRPTFQQFLSAYKAV